MYVCRQLLPGVTRLEVRLPCPGPLGDGDVVQHLGVARHDRSLVFEFFTVSQQILSRSEVLDEFYWFVKVVLDHVRHA